MERMKAMNEHLDARISAGQLAVTLTVSRLSMILFLPSLTGTFTAREYLLAGMASFLLCAPFFWAAHHGHGKPPALYAAFASLYLLFCAAASISWLYTYLLSVTDNPVSAFVFGTLMISSAIYALYCGPEAIARISLVILAIFIAASILSALSGAQKMSASHLSTAQTVLAPQVTMTAAVNAFAHPETALFLLLRGNVADEEKLGKSAARYCLWSTIAQCTFFFLLELLFSNAIFAREYPASLLLGNALCAALFIALTSVRLYAFCTGATIGLKKWFGKRSAIYLVFTATAILSALLMHFRRNTSIVLQLMLILGAALYLLTTIFLLGGKKDEPVRKKGNSDAAHGLDGN